MAKKEKFLMINIKDGDDYPCGALTALPTKFRTGSTGFRATSKIMIDGERYVANLYVVKIGSKVTDYDWERDDE
jgi:hypothetical protein